MKYEKSLFRIQVGRHSTIGKIRQISEKFQLPAKSSKTVTLDLKLLGWICNIKAKNRYKKKK